MRVIGVRGHLPFLPWRMTEQHGGGATMGTYKRWGGAGWSLPPRHQRVAEYRAYLESDHWRRIREEALERDGHACAACGALEDLEVHHLIYLYPRHWERSEGLLTLCREHHRYVHGRISPRHGADRTMPTKWALAALGLDYRPPWLSPYRDEEGNLWRQNWVGHRRIPEGLADDAG